jgi:hypothetical protein
MTGPAVEGRDGTMLRPPSINQSPSGAARYAMEHGCVPFVRDGTPVLKRMRPAFYSRRDTNVLAVSTRVSLETGSRGECTIRSTHGDPQALRKAVLDALQSAGAQPRSIQDSGLGSRDSIGHFRQETHCLTLNGRPGYLVMSTSGERNRPKLQASIGVDSNGPCDRAAG